MEKRDKIITVLLNDEEKKDLTNLAERNQLSLSSYIRSVLCKKLREDS